MEDSVESERALRGLVYSNTCRSCAGATMGDLGFFSEYRMPPDFVAAVIKMHVGEISPPVRTRMGFHIIQLTDSKPARQMAFEEAQREVALKLENEKRQSALQSLATDLGRRAEFVCPPG